MDLLKHRLFFTKSVTLQSTPLFLIITALLRYTLSSVSSHQTLSTPTSSYQPRTIAGFFRVLAGGLTISLLAIVTFIFIGADWKTELNVDLRIVAVAGQHAAEVLVSYVAFLALALRRPTYRGTGLDIRSSAF